MGGESRSRPKGHDLQDIRPAIPIEIVDKIEERRCVTAMHNGTRLRLIRSASFHKTSGIDRRGRVDLTSDFEVWSQVIERARDYIHNSVVVKIAGVDAFRVKKVGQVVLPKPGLRDLGGHF